MINIMMIIERKEVIILIIQILIQMIEIKVINQIIEVLAVKKLFLTIFFYFKNIF